MKRNQIESRMTPVLRALPKDGPTQNVPMLSDMKSMLRLAVQACALPADQRPGHILRGMIKLVGGSFVFAWTIDRDHEPGAGLVWPEDRGITSPDIDPAAALMLRTQRVILPLVRHRDELLNETVWSQAVPRHLRDTRRAIYSVHRLDQRRRSLVAIYDTSRRGAWTERERIILRLLHSQCVRCLHPQPTNGHGNGF